MSSINFVSFLIPQTIEKFNSSFNGEIRVVKFLGKPRIIVKGLIQSGGMIELIWGKGIKKIAKLLRPEADRPLDENCQIVNCLILGLGGGTAAKIIHNKFPKAKIIGVEIDPVMIKLGKKYFGLDKLKNLTIINDDALKTLPRLRIKYDLVLVDLYLGDQIPLKSESETFLRHLKKLLGKHGIIIFNRLFYGKNRQTTENFIKKLDKIFPRTELIRAWSNLLVVSRK